MGESVSNVLFVPGGQTFLTHRRGGDKHFSHTGGDKHFCILGGQTFFVGGGGGFDDVDEEIDELEFLF